MFVFLTVFLVIFIKSFIKILTSHNLAKGIRKQIAAFRPHAILLRGKVELALQTNADTNSKTSSLMTQITQIIDEIEYNTPTQFSLITSMSRLFRSIQWTIPLSMMIIMMRISDNLAICANAKSIAPSPAGGFAHTI